jgi:hypothetical protein
VAVNDGRLGAAAVVALKWRPSGSATGAAEQVGAVRGRRLRQSLLYRTLAENVLNATRVLADFAGIAHAAKPLYLTLKRLLSQHLP